MQVPAMWKLLVRLGTRGAIARLAICLFGMAASPTCAWAVGENSVWISDYDSPGSDAAGSPVEPFLDVFDIDRTTNEGEQVQFQDLQSRQIDATQPTALPSTAQRANAQLLSGLGGLSGTVAGLDPAGYDIASRSEAVLRATTDTGDLLGTSPTVLNLGVQRRNPIVNDPRVRGSRVGSLAASGSYWVPARIDLDTAISKIDSRVIDEVVVIPGPYSALYGPGFEIIDVQLASAPRFGEVFETHGASSVDYKTNGEQWYGRQSVWGGDEVWGFRGSYGHRTGNDYRSGDGTLIPSSYKSRDVDFAAGTQLTVNSALDFNYLRQDQTDVELAGQAFDIDWLVMDGYDVRYVLENQAHYDRLEIESWYNRTRFEGDAQRPSKRRQFPFYDFIQYVGFTDVDSLSTGYTAKFHWDGLCDERLIAGTDLRFVNQELNEISSGRLGFFAWDNANSPIPRSYSANPGLFVQYQTDSQSDTRLTTGARVDGVPMDITADPASLESLGIIGRPASWILGSSEFYQAEFLGAGFATLERSLGDNWTSGVSAGYAERSPNQTERYAVEPFMFLIQNGLNTVTGAPGIDKERRLQVDLRLSKTEPRYRLQANVFYAWVNDHITFEAMSVVPSVQDVQQVNLKYVNTDLARLWGAEARGEYDWTPSLTPFATLRYVEGDDRTRDGTFATRQATAAVPSEQVAGLPRGFFSGLGGGATEPLPGILPLETWLGLRWHEAATEPNWGLELAMRVVDEQDRVAASLRESTTPGFTVYDLRGYWRPRELLMLVGGIENLTDKQYREHLDYRSLSGGESVFRPGISLYAGTEWTY